MTALDWSVLTKKCDK